MVLSRSGYQCRVEYSMQDLVEVVGSDARLGNGTPLRL